MALIPLSEEAFQMQQGRHACQYVNATSRFFWEDYLDTEVKSRENKTLVATLFMPVKNAEEALQIAHSKALNMDSSGDVIVSFNRNGEEYTFNFENRKGGLVLKE